MFFLVFEGTVANLQDKRQAWKENINYNKSKRNDLEEILTWDSTGHRTPAGKVLV